MLQENCINKREEPKEKREENLFENLIFGHI